MNKFLGVMNINRLTVQQTTTVETRMNELRPIHIPLLSGQQHVTPRKLFTKVNSPLCCGKKGLHARAAVAAWFFVATCFAQATYQFDGPARLPDPKITPGVVRTTVTKDVCSQGTKQFRHTTTAMKARVYAMYGQVDHKGACAGAEGCEIDHLISLELGGADAVNNLWPQPYGENPGAHEKDKVENYLHKQVCSGKMKLADAQSEISSNWYRIYLQIK